MNDKAFWNLISCLLGMAIGALIVLTIATSDAHAAKREITSSDRIIYSVLLENDYQKGGYELYAVTYGPNHTWLLLRCKQFVDGEIVNNLIKDSIPEWREFGITEVTIFSGESMVVINVQKAYDISVGKEKM